MCRNNTPNDDEMWNMADEDREIERTKIGVNTPKRQDGLQTLNEGFNFLQFNDQDDNVYKGREKQ